MGNVVVEIGKRSRLNSARAGIYRSGAGLGVRARRRVPAAVRLAAALAAGMLAWSLRAGELLICPRCGVESRSGSVTCARCGAELPEGAAESPAREAAAAEPLPGEGPFIAAAVVEEELRQGNEFLAQKQPDLAHLFFRNASALEVLTDPRLGGDRAERILTLRQQTESDRTVRRECRVCGGTGKATLSTLNLKRERMRVLAHGASCPECQGRGFIAAPEPVSARKLRTGRARQQFEAIQQSRKYERVGGAWVPAGCERGLTTRQQAALRRAAAPPCAACAGQGRLECPDCGGLGRVKCPNRSCERGRVRVTDKPGRGTRLAGDREETCETCHGSGAVACAGCDGKGHLLCQRCGGTGQSPACARCGGEGILACRRCHGCGIARGRTCADCGGEGVVLCASCHGDGCKP